MVDHVFGFCWIQIYRLLSRTKDIFVTIGMNRFQTKFFAHPGFRSWVGVNLKLSTTELSSINVNWFSIKILFSDQVSGCDFEFSSVLRRWWEGGMKGYNGEDMEGVWSVQQITLYWTFTTSANIIVIVVVCFHLLLFLTFWNTIGFPTNCWQILNWSQFQSVLPLFSVFLFAIWDFWWQILLLHAEEDLSFVCVLNEVGYCKTKFCDDLFFCSFNNLQKDWWELGFVCW